MARPIFRHCDDYIDDETTPQCLRTFLDYARSPAHGAMRGTNRPKLFADFQERRVRITMASRFGDVGINYKLNQEHGYDLRVSLSNLTNFSERRGI